LHPRRPSRSSFAVARPRTPFFDLCFTRAPKTLTPTDTRAWLGEVNGHSHACVAKCNEEPISKISLRGTNVDDRVRDSSPR
jgi:hypothetical protein